MLVKIGQGRFSNVYAIEQDGKVQALKEVGITLSSSPIARAALKSVLREILSLRAIGYHPNIVEYLGYSICKGAIAIHLEYCKLDLDGLMAKCDSHIPLEIV